MGGDAPFGTAHDIIVRGGEGRRRRHAAGPLHPVGEAAINPVPRKMVADAVMEAVAEAGSRRGTRPASIEVTICVTGRRGDSEKDAQQPPRHRRRHIDPRHDGHSQAPLRRGMDCDDRRLDERGAGDGAGGRSSLSTGRSSERAHMARYGLPEESYVMMGDYVEYALLAAKTQRVRKGAPLRPVGEDAENSDGDAADARAPRGHGPEKSGGLPRNPRRSGPGRKGIQHGPRDMRLHCRQTGRQRASPFSRSFALRPRRYAESVTEGLPVCVHLVSYNGEVIATDG